MSVYIYRLSQWIEKKFNAKGGNVITDFEQAARAVLPLPIGVEERYLQGWNRFAIVVNIGPVAAQFSDTQIRNPANSNVIVVVEQITCNSSVGDNPFVAWGSSVTDFTTVVSLAFTRMDPRGNPQPTAIVSKQTSVGIVGVPQLQRNVQSTGSVDFINNVDQQIPVLPGQALDVNAQTANTNLIVSYMWRERALELSELT